MQRAARTKHFLIDLFSFSSEQLTLELINTAHTNLSLGDVGNKLITIAEDAYALRRMDVVEQASHLLMNMPPPYQYEQIGHYYRALSIKRQGKFEEARSILERVADNAPLRYRARAILTIGATFFDRAEYDASLPFYREANKVASCSNWCDPVSTLIARRMTAVLKSLEGDNQGALAQLKSLLPLAKAVSVWYPSEYYNHLNSLAVELTQAGEVNEAEHLCRRTLASPYAFAYPEWRETGKDIAARGYKSRSLVPLTHKGLQAKNVLRLPVPESVSSVTSSPTEPAKILNYSDWKKKMGKEPDGDGAKKQDSGEATDREMLLRIVELASTDNLPDVALREMVEALEEIVKAHKQKQS